MAPDGEMPAAPSDARRSDRKRWTPFAWLRRMKASVEALAESPHAPRWLFLVAFAESSFFPIPPDALLLPLAVSAPRRALRFAAICTAGSVAGALLGWAIGYLLYDTVGRAILDFYQATRHVEYVLARFQQNAVVAIVIAGFTPIPYKVFTILAGMTQATASPVGLPVLLGASLIGRGLRFFLVGGLVRAVGPSVSPFVDRHFDVLAVVFGALLIGGIIAVKALL